MYLRQMLYQGATASPWVFICLLVCFCFLNGLDHVAQTISNSSYTQPLEYLELWLCSPVVWLDVFLISKAMSGISRDWKRALGSVLFRDQTESWQGWCLKWMASLSSLTIKYCLFYFNYTDSSSCSTLTEMWAFGIVSHFNSAWIGFRHSHGVRSHEPWFESEISSTSSCLECLFPSWWHYLGGDCGTFWWWWNLAHRSRSVGVEPLHVIAWLLVLSFLLPVPLWYKQPMTGISEAVSWVLCHAFLSMMRTP